MTQAVRRWIGRRRAACTFVVAAGALLATGSPARGQSPANVAVVINQNSPASIRIGEHYIRKRSVPAENVIKVDVAATEEITRARYSADLEAPIARALAKNGQQDRILYIVLTKGIPLRITGTVGPMGTAGSVDSELTLLYRRMTGRAVPPAGPLENPYYAGDLTGNIGRKFSHEDHDVYLVARLDALTVEDAIALIDRSLTPEAQGAIVLDQRSGARWAVADRWLSEAADAIKSQSPESSVLLEQSATAAAHRPAFGYFSWGRTDPALASSTVDVSFVPGSIAATFGSTDAASLAADAGASKILAGELVRSGATGVGGNVSEPYLQSSFRPQILFPAYLAGLTLGEAFYRALPHLSWQSVVIGDPLTRPFGRSALPTAVDAPVDPTTALPAYFSARRLESVRADFPGVSRDALEQLLASEVHHARQDLQRAIEAMTRAADRAPEVPAIHLRLALLHEEAGHGTEAIGQYRHVVTLQPRSPIALNNLAYALATRSGELDEALQLARKAYALAPEEGTIIDTVGWIEHLRGNTGEATKLLRMAVQRAPKHAEVRLHAALALAEAGTLDEARAQLDAAIELNPSIENRDDVRRLRERLRK